MESLEGVQYLLLFLLVSFLLLCQNTWEERLAWARVFKVPVSYQYALLLGHVVRKIILIGSVWWSFLFISLVGATSSHKTAGLALSLQGMSNFKLPPSLRPIRAWGESMCCTQVLRLGQPWGSPSFMAVFSFLLQMITHGCGCRCWTETTIPTTSMATTSMYVFYTCQSTQASWHTPHPDLPRS